jgi:hypothetical protein
MLWAQAILPASWASTFERAFTSELNCQVSSTRPFLNFGFRYQAGYLFTTPLSQFFGPGHRLTIVTRVTNRQGKAVYLGQGLDLPPVPKTKQILEMGGGYLVGEGEYQVDWLLFDEQNRACRKSWKAKVARSGADKRVPLAIAPDTVAEFSLAGLAPQQTREQTGGPLTVLLNAAPVSPRRTRLRSSDGMLLVGALSTLLERIGARPIRLIVFNLDKRQELYRREGFRPVALGEVADAINQLELGLVDYEVLKSPKGHVEFLADLLNREADTETVVLLGPTTRYFDRMPGEKLEEGRARIFNLQLLPYFLGTPFPDIFDSAARRRKGKSKLIRTPADFAKAIEAL